MNMPLVSMNRRRRIGGAATPVFSPSALFALAEPGVWYDPSDLTTLFQDTAGTTPVTTPGQTVALALDKSKGLVLGAELVTNGTFGTDTDWTKGAGWTISGGQAVATNVAGTFLSQVVSVVAGRTYRVQFTTTRSAGNYEVRLGGTPIVSGITGNLTFDGFAVAGSTTLVIDVRGFSYTGSIDNISVKELPGFHATQATLASRPTYGIVPLGGRRNLLTYSNDLSNAAWTKVQSPTVSYNETGPDGLANSAATISNTNNLAVYFSQTVSVSNDALSRTASFFVKKTTSAAKFPGIQFGYSGGTAVNAAATINTDNGSLTQRTGAFAYSNSSVESVGGYWRISITLANNNTGNTSCFLFIFPVVAASSTGTWSFSTGSAVVYGAQLETGSSATAYQRVGSAFDVTEAGVASLSYLSFDGIDDHLVTPSVNFSTDKMTVFAGVRKLSDAAFAMVAETGTGLQNGSIFLAAPGGAAANYRLLSRGTTNGDAIGTTFAAPITNVLTGLGDISGDLATLRVNGTQAAQSTADQGTGNFLAYPLYIGRRGGASLPFNGQLFSLIVRNAATDAATITSSETWVAGKTGVTL